METPSLFKRASLAIRELYSDKQTLQKEVDELKDELTKLSAAKDITLKLMKLGAFPIEDFEDHFNKFSEKTTEELETFEKAAQLVKTGAFDFNIGTLSEQPTSGDSAEDRFVYTLLED